MNKTVTTNIGGFIFHIDDNAYEKLSQYLSTIKGYFTQSEGRDEIIGDIEARIAEMFREKTGNQKQVVTLKDVDEVIAVMGQPEAFAESGEGATTSAAQPVTPRNRARRIFRDPDNKVIGGVCGGVSAYFNIDPIWLRLAFALALLVFGTGVLLYIVLWVIIPKARTTAEKLEMRGESVNVHNIERTIREEMDELKQRFHALSDDAKDLGKKEGKLRNAVNDVVDFFASFFRLVFKAVGKLIGAFFTFIGIVLLAAVIASLLGFPGIVKITGHGHEISMSVQEMLSRFIGSPQLINWAMAGCALLICVPLLGLLFAGLKLLFDIKSKNKAFSIAMLVFWISGLTICILVAVHVSNDFKIPATQKAKFNVAKPSKGATLYLEVNNNLSDIEEQSGEIGQWMIFSDGEQNKLFRHPQFDIEKSMSDSIELELIRYAKGASRKEALANAEKVNYKFSQNDSILLFDKYFELSKDDKWRMQEVKMVLRLPVGQTVFLNDDMKHIIYDIGNITNTWDYDMVNRRWIMTQKGLACVDCDNLQNIKKTNDEDWEDVPEAPEVPDTPQAPSAPKKQKKKTEATLSDSGITREQYELLSKLNRMYLELKASDTSRQQVL